MTVPADKFIKEPLDTGVQRVFGQGFFAVFTDGVHDFLVALGNSPCWKAGHHRAKHGPDFRGQAMVKDENAGTGFAQVFQGES